jgi:hypothetical protein
MTDGQSSSLSWCQAPIWEPRPIFDLFSLIIVRQLRVCWCGAPSLTRSRVRIFQLLLGIASAVLLGSESRGISDRILLSQFLRLPQPGGPSSRIYFPQEQGSPVTPTGIGLLANSFNRIYKHSFRTSQETHSVSVTKSRRLMLFRGELVVYCENRIWHKYITCAECRILVY